MESCLIQRLRCIFIHISFLSSAISAAQDCDPYGFGGTPCAPETTTPTTTPKPIQPSTPTTSTDVGLPITIPVLGTINLIPFTDTTQTPAVTGFKVNITKPNEKLTIGPATIDDGYVSLIGDKLGMTGRLTIFGKQARFGIKDVSLQPSKQGKIIQRIVLTATFLPDSSTLTLGGITLPLGTVDITLEQGKAPVVQTHIKADTLTPFATTNIPVLNTLKFTNLDVQLDVAKNKNNKLTPTIIVTGDTEILGVKVNTVIKEVVDQNGKPGIYVNAPLPKNWKFSDSIAALKGTFFDGLVFNQAWLIACSVDYNDPDRNIMVKKGLSFYAQVPLSGSLANVGKLLGSTDQTFTMYGKIDPNPHNINLGIIVSQGSPINTAKVSVGNTQVILSGEPHVGVTANVIVHPSPQDTLTFAGEFDLQPTTATLNASMDGTWNNPLGIKGFILHNIALKLGIQYLPPPPKPTLVGISAGMQINNNTINFASVADATLQHMALQGHVDRLSFMDIVTSFAQPMGLKLPRPSFPVFDLNNVDVRFAATDTTIGNQTIAQGVTMIADMNVLNKKANVQVNVGGLLEGIKIFGSVDPINIANILKIDGRNGSSKPEIDIELSLARQNFLIQGELSLANLYKTATYIAITTAGIEFDFIDSINNNTLLYSHVHGQSSGSLSNPQFKISIDFEQHLQHYIKDRVTEQFAQEQRQVIDSINAAQRQVDTLQQVKADARKKLEDARNQVIKTEQSLQGTTKILAQPALYVAQKFLEAVEEVANGILQLSDDAAQEILNAAQQTGVGVLQGTTWVANKTLSQFDVTKIHYDGNLQDLSKGVLGNVHVEAQIIKPLQFNFSLDPNNIAGSINSITTQLSEALKHAFVDPLTPHVNQMKTDNAAIVKAQQLLGTLKPSKN